MAEAKLNLNGSWRSVHSEGANGALPEGSREGVFFCHVVPSTTVDFLAANQPQA